MKPEIGDLVELPEAPEKSPIAVLFPKKISDFGLIIEISKTKMHTAANKKKEGWICNVISGGQVHQHWFEDLKVISKMRLD